MDVLAGSRAAGMHPLFIENGRAGDVLVDVPLMGEFTPVDSPGARGCADGSADGWMP